MTWMGPNVAEGGASLRASPHVEAIDLGEELVLHDSATGNVHVLNITARMVWDSLQQGQPMTDIVQHICAAFDGAPADTVTADVTKIYTDFCRSGLIT